MLPPSGYMWEMEFRRLKLQLFLNGCSVTKSCLAVCDTHGLQHARLLYHQLPELAQTHVLQVSDAIQPSHPLSPLSLPALNLSQHQGLFQWVSWLSPSDSQSIGASASVLPVNIQGWYSLRLTSLISLLSKGLKESPAP